ncbi:MAG: hypothetical protein HC771_08535 [Synechococcales cyanobacterium CRU_2_2]|nr:hypothetical protein [Synechococcales cyanobacterium CRU_2_2]
MLRIHPKIDFSANCPSDHTGLELEGICIPNLHCLVEATCPTCNAQYYIDLPIGQAIWSPVTLNKSTSEIFEPLEMDWFSQPLRDGLLNQEKSEILPIVHKFFNSDRIIIINCLDFLYGHSLLKLLNVQRHLDESPDLGCCVMVPTQLKHLVPEGVAEIWELPIPIKDGKKWYPSLAKWINEQCQQRKECFLSKVYSHPSHQVYDLDRFVRGLPDISSEVTNYSPIILFSYRADRTWGKTVRQQQANLQNLYGKLSSIFPDMLFVLVGFGQENYIQPSGAKLVDLRSNKFDVELDRLWMAYMKAADCAVGVHGSNMLLPSGLAKSTIELVYTSRLGNSVQDFLFGQHLKDPRDALLYYRMLYGNDVLSDIHPSTIASSIANIVSFARVNSAWFKVGQETSEMKFDMHQKLLKQGKNHFSNPEKRSFINRTIRKLAHSVITLID